MNYDEAWIVLYGMGQKLSLRTGAMFRLDHHPIVRVELVHYERHAGFIVTHAEWAIAGSNEKDQMDLLRRKMADAEIDLYETSKVAHEAAHKSANCASDSPDNVPQRPGAVGSDKPQGGLPND